MSGLETQIFRAFTAAIDTFVAENPIDLAYPNALYTPGAGPYLRPWMLPAPTSAFDYRATNEYRGVMQIDVFWPAGLGLVAPLEMAAALIAFFPRGSQLAGDDLTVSINEPPYLGPALQEPGWIQIPVSIRFRALA